MARVTPVSRTVPAVSANMSRSALRRPNSFTSSAPLTLKRSAIVADIVPCSCMRWRLSATIRGLSALSITTSNGMISSDASVTCHDRRHHGGEHDAEQADVGPDRGERAHRGLRADDVGTHAVEQRAGLRAGEERERQLLAALEHGHAQVEDEPFADVRAEPAGNGSQRGLAQRRGDREHEQQVDRAQVLVRDRVVDEALEDQRGRDGNTCGRSDREQVEDQLEPVGRGEAPGPFESGAIDLGGLIPPGHLCHRDHAVGLHVLLIVRRGCAPTIWPVFRRLIVALLLLPMLVACSSGGGGPAKQDTPTPAAGLTRYSGPPPWPLGDQQAKRIEAAGHPGLKAEGSKVHYHAHLDVFYNGEAVLVPANIGIDFEEEVISPMHTHTPSGIIHIEANEDVEFTLAQFLIEWGVKPDLDLTLYVDGKPSTAGLDLVIRPDQQIALDCRHAAGRDPVDLRLPPQPHRRLRQDPPALKRNW